MKLITDRTQSNTIRLSQLATKDWDTMSAAERAEWSGDPLTAADCNFPEAVNLIPPVGTSVTFRDGAIMAESEGTVIIGEAADFSGNAVTHSAEYVSEGGNLLLAWSDGTDAGCSLSVAGANTATLSGSVGTQLVLTAAPGYYGKAMLELGRVPHEYVPYTEIIATNATKGAYNFSDFNRVERAVAEIAEILAVSVDTKTDWNVWDTPTESDLRRYLSNVRLLRDLCRVETVLPEHLDKMTYATANTIEEVLLSCRRVAEKHYRCGEIYSGEV